ncbi:histidine ammonia-lyase [Candidatus Planktophila lacus]|uniref:Histidine ammonia-lyase n=1 Tax=Candidatus Planktophila lacus TaxID=1884913 RepID=A0AAD0E487_9ACTN|nr:histidine ammonia-lyase [Candidatus Planktophila lacus]ASY10266.1 histidine ammonia-lyase [Candidatus Planktophila lacus]
MASKSNRTVTLSTSGVTFADVIDVARYGAKVELSKQSIDAINASRKYIEEYAAGGIPVYGVSTGFGALANRHIDVADRAQLQKSLIRSHAAGVGPAVEREVVRALMFLRLRTMASGRTGVRVALAQSYIDFLNHGITPVVPEFGSLGCSGDLAPLSHCALALMGEGKVHDANGVEMPTMQALDAAGIKPIELQAKEGLALINGTDGMLGMLIMACADLEQLCAVADITTAMSIEGLLGTDRVFAPDLHAPLRPQVGQAVSAANIFAMLKGSGIVASHRENDSRVQDAYSLRCAPQVAGAVRDTISYASTIAERELASAIDNPVVLPDGRVESNGNFHGAPVAYVLDFLAIAATDLGSIAERRTDRALDQHRSAGLPPFLAHDPGVDSGLMIAQYTQAGLVSENKRLATPASVDSIPSSAMQEDHVSMGWSAARKLRKVVDNLARILAIELVTAARAIELREGLSPSPATGRVVKELRKVVPGVGPDRFLSPELEAATTLVNSGSIVNAAREVVKELI